MKAIRRRESLGTRLEMPSGSYWTRMMSKSTILAHQRINAILDICKISRTGDESIKIIMRNVSAEVVWRPIPEAEKGGRVYNAVRALRGIARCTTDSAARFAIVELQRLVVLLNNEASDHLSSSSRLLGFTRT